MMEYGYGKKADSRIKAASRIKANRWNRESILSECDKRRMQHGHED